MPEPEPVPVVESVEVAPSEDNGNVPADAPVTPSEPVTPDAPTDKVEPATPAAPAEPELFELPDGRKVDAATLTKEWKENFLPDYTRKSQELAAKKTETLPTPPANKYADPAYVPQTYEEIIKEAEARALATLDGREQARITAQKALEDTVVSQLTEIKKTDPGVVENDLFLHANKYGFRDLRQAHANMRDMRELAKKVKQVTAADIAKRTDPVSVSPGATGARPDPANFSSAVEYMRSLK